MHTETVRFPQSMMFSLPNGRTLAFDATVATLRLAQRSESMLMSKVNAQTDAEWDAGDMGCGELVFDLRLRLSVLAPGTVLRLRATDPGAIEDIPAWCRLTGNPLLSANPPIYLIRRKGA